MYYIIIHTIYLFEGHSSRGKKEMMRGKEGSRDPGTSACWFTLHTPCTAKAVPRSDRHKPGGEQGPCTGARICCLPVPLAGS